MKIGRLLLCFIVFLGPGFLLAQDTALNNLFERVKAQRKELEQQKKDWAGKITMLNKSLEEDSNAVIDLRKIVAEKEKRKEIEADLAKIKNPNEEIDPQLKAKRADIKKALKAKQVLESQANALKISIDDLDKKEAVTSGKRTRLDKLSRDAESMEQENNTLRADLSSWKARKAALTGQDKEIAAANKRNEVLTVFLLKDYGDKVKAVTADEYFSIAGIESLEKANKKLIDLFSAQNLVYKKIDDYIVKYYKAGDFIEDVIDLFKENYNKTMIEQLLQKYKDLDNYAAFTEEQRDRLTSYFNRLKNYCQYQNKIADVLLAGEALLKNGKRKEAVAKIRQCANEYNSNVFSFIYNQLQQLADYTEKSANTGLINECLIRRQQCQ